MSTVMIVGASRGIGLELTKQYAEAGDQVIACARDTAAAEKLDSLAEASKNIVIKGLDIGDPKSIDAAKSEIGESAIDKLIIVAGTTGGEHQSLDDLSIEEWHTALNINTIGPALVARAFK